jgi:lysozyme family protein
VRLKNNEGRMDFDTAFHKLLGHEGGYSNHAQDPGGETMWGVTKRVAVANGYNDSMRALPVDTAKQIYRKDYWLPIRADELPESLRYPMFDAAVNSGVKQSIWWLQYTVGATVDGSIGPQTLSLAGKDNPEILVRKLLGIRLNFMTDLDTWSSFGRGWAKRIASLLREG